MEPTNQIPNSLLKKTFGKHAHLIAEHLKKRVPQHHLGNFTQMMVEWADGGDPAKKWQWLPVPIEVFIEGSYYLDKAGTVYPAVMRELKQMNSGKYVEIVLTGGIGSAKTTCALYTQAYQLYLLSCLNSPHAMYGLDPSSEILIVFQNINERLAKSVDYQRFRHMIAGSKYFMGRFPFNKDLESRMVFPHRIEVVPISGQESAAIGQNVMGGIIDELNYMAVTEKSKLSIDSGTYDQAVVLYNSIARRRKSRFMEQGQLPGILCLVSSKRYPGQFTDKKTEEAATDPTIYVYDKRVWDVKPEGTFSGVTFPVFVGDETRKPHLMEDDEVVADADRNLVDYIPVEYKKEFEDDIINALREIAGRSTLARFPFFTNVEKIAQSMGKVQSVFSRPDVDFVETQLRLLDKNFWRPEIPRYAHVDLALSSDSAGLAIGTITGYDRIRRNTAESEKEMVEILPHIRIDGVLEIKPPKGGEILFWKVRQIFYTLREMGLNIIWVSFDSYQSTDSMQMLGGKGYKAGYVSMDTTTLPYDITKSAFYDGRVDMPFHQKLLTEMASLEQDPKKGKIDHPPRGSKDCADAVAGVIYGISRRREMCAWYNIPPSALPHALQMAMSVTTDKNAQPMGQEVGGNRDA